MRLGGWVDVGLCREGDGSLRAPPVMSGVAPADRRVRFAIRDKRRAGSDKPKHYRLPSAGEAGIYFAPKGQERYRGIENQPRREERMLWWAVVFLVIALVAALFGFGGISSAAAGIAKVLFAIFLVLFIIALIGNFVG
jgi:uncharacterized membrane protein YtjA (UPF0391 family)